MTYGDLFVSVRQRRVAFTYYLEFFAPVKYGKSLETDYLDTAYRFPYMTADEKFLRYCAKRDGYAYDDYMSLLCQESGCAKPAGMVNSSHEEGKEDTEAQEA